MKNNQPITTHTKTPSQRGKWVFKPLRSKVVVCSCGNKYIATRDKQTTCVICMRGKK